MVCRALQVHAGLQDCIAGVQWGIWGYLGFLEKVLVLNLGFGLEGVVWAG